MSKSNTTFNEIVHEFKRKYYITAVVTNNWNIAKTSRTLAASRCDMYNHIGNTHAEHVELAKKYGLIE